ncbi:TonB family protein [bacterium]|nr:TonB family protein [bacterium]
MSLQTQRQLRRAAQAAHELRRDGWLLGAAIALHALLVLMIPGVAAPELVDKVVHFTLQAPQPQEPRIAQQLPPPPTPLPENGTASKATAPTIDKLVRPDTPPHPNLPPTTKHSGKDKSERKPAAASPKPSKQPSNKPAPNTPAAKPKASPSSSSPAKDASDATDVVVREPISAPVKTKPTDNSQPAKKGDSAKPNPGDKGTKPQPGKGDGGGGNDKKDEGPAPQNAGNASPGDAKPSAPKDGDPKGSGDGSGAPSGGGPATAPAEGPPALPAGPTDAELDALGSYGDKLREKIRQMARNPEIAREKGHKGPVKFSFTVSRRGKLLGVSITDSSGYGELDEEAREATRVAAGTFPPFPKSVVSVEKWTFSMTLKFPLY